jgi:hypothetical protein
MKADLELYFVSDLGVEIRVIANVESLEIKTKDGDHESRVCLTSDDALELAKMLVAASEHKNEQD